MLYPESSLHNTPVLNGVSWLVPDTDEEGLKLITQDVRPLSPFSDIVISFLDDLFFNLSDHPLKRVYPEVTTFAFFCRRSNLMQLQKPYQEEIKSRFGRGRVFHITPSNVPMNFAYSLVAALLAGNSSVVRVSSKEVEQVEIVIQSINELLNRGDYQELIPYIQILRYGREYKENTQMLSSNCDIRVIWGGDESIEQIRKAALPAHAFDITFADRTSLAVIRAETISIDTVRGITQGFYNDTYLNDQNACTSPWMIAWVGTESEIRMAKELFWRTLEERVQEQYSLNEISGVDKLATFMQHSVDAGGNLSLTDRQTNSIWRVKADVYSSDFDKHRCNSGYFLELDIESLNALFPKLSRNYQSLAYAGFEKEELLQTLRESKSQGIDRIVPIGRTQDFSLNWDGYDLIRSMSRVIN
ncbi:MAG: acyl-CoA reductase [Balneolaceae bacterium]